MRLLNQSYELISPDLIQQHPRNVNQGDVGAIHESVNANGFYGAVIVQRSTGNILAGNHRWLTAKQQKATEIPVIWVDVDDETAVRILLADNRTTRLGVDDDQALIALLMELQSSTGSIAGTGYSTDDLAEMIAAMSSGASEQQPGEDESSRLKEKWELIVTCRDEAHQVEIMQLLMDMGVECKALVA